MPLSRFEKLTDREKQVLSCIRQGRTSKGAGKILDISPRTVDNHLHRIMKKMQCNCREELLDLFEKGNLLNHALPDISNSEKQDKKMPPQLNVQKRCIFWSAITAIGVFLFFEKQHYFTAYTEDPDLHVHSNISPFSCHTYLNRKPILWRMEKSFQEASKFHILALVGSGGSGKTTLARLYSHQSKYPLIWELNAETPNALMKSMEDLMENLALSDEEQKAAQKIKRIKDPLLKREKILPFIFQRLQKKKDWLLIFDNVEDFNFLLKHIPIEQHHQEKGNVIITTTDENIRHHPHVNQCIIVDKLTPEEKLQLYNQIVYQQQSNPLTRDESKKLKSLLEMLPPYPLDVSAAAYYMKTTRTSIGAYRERLEKSRESLCKSQASILKDASNYGKTRYQIIQMTLSKIVEKNEDFFKLLILLSLVDSQKIPKNLLDSFKDAVFSDSFIYTLKKYSLITNETFEKNGPLFSIHRSTQEIALQYISRRLKKKNLLDHQHVFTFLEEHLSKLIDQEDFAAMGSLVPHYESLLKQNNLLDPRTRASFKGLLGCVYYYLRNLSLGKTYLVDALEILSKEKQVYPTAPKISMYLGKLYNISGSPKQAKKQLEQTLDMHKKTGHDLYGMARTLGNLGVAHRHLGHYTLAQSYMEQSLALHEKYFPSHIGHAWIMTLLGCTYNILGKAKKALPLLEKSLTIYQQYSEDYVGAAWVMGHLGNTHRVLGNYQKAKELLEGNLDITKKHFTDDHIFLASAMILLGVLYLEINEIDQAIHYLEKSLGIYQKKSKLDSVKLARNLYYLGMAYLKKEDKVKANVFFNQSVEIYKKTSHPEIYLPLQGMGDVCQQEIMDTQSNTEKNAWAIKRDAFYRNSQSILKNRFPPNFRPFS